MEIRLIKRIGSLVLGSLLFLTAAFPVLSEEAAVSSETSASKEAAASEEATAPEAAVSSEAAATDSPFSGSLQTHLGVFFGGMTEYVYEKGRDHELSRLDWEENGVPYLVVIGDFGFKNWFIDLSLITAIPVKSGVMQDYDFMLPGSNKTSHYSKHDAMFDKHLEIAPKLGYNFAFGNWYLSPSAGILYRNRKWSAVNGYVQYPVSGAWNSHVEKKDMAGVVISYEEAIWFPTISISGGYTIKDRVTIGGTFTYYPYLFVQTIDSHMLRATRFHDEMKGGWGCLAEISATYIPKRTDILNFMLAVGFEGIYPPKGTTSSGAIGYDNGLVLDSGYESKMMSNLGWVSMGIMMFPELLFNK